MFEFAGRLLHNTNLGRVGDKRQCQAIACFLQLVNKRRQG